MSVKDRTGMNNNQASQLNYIFKDDYNSEEFPSLCVDNSQTERTSCSSSWWKVLSWALQILTWATIAILLIALLRKKANVYLIIITFIIYLAYIINSYYNSSTYIYLTHLIKSQSMVKYIEKLNKINPEIKFKAENYHHDDPGFWSKKGKKKVITSTNETIFNYSSCRDISDVFDISETKKRTYLKLKLGKQTKFFLDESELLFNEEKDKFIKENKGLDVSSDFFFTEEIPGYEPLILARLAEKENLFINSSVYFICTVMFPIVELYKIYVDSDCEIKSFKIVKLISVRNNLNRLESNFGMSNENICEEAKSQYAQDLNPDLNVINKKYDKNIIKSLDDNESKQPLLEK